MLLLLLFTNVTVALATSSSFSSFYKAIRIRTRSRGVVTPLLAFATSPPPPPSPAWRTFLDSILPSSASTSNVEKNQVSQQRNEIELLKREIINTCQINYGRNTPMIRGQIESSIDKRTLYNPTFNTATSPLLQRKWIVLWTSEKEINFFLENGISNEITQVLSEGEVLENYIPFVNIGGGNGGFGVTGRISVDVEERGGPTIRTNFKFEKAALNLGRWGTYTFPPVGEGWFDTIYLDDGTLVLAACNVSCLFTFSYNILMHDDFRYH
jgi:hypothetical protein